MGKLLAQQGGEPRLIEQHLLARRFPEGADLLGFAPGRKGLVLDGQGHERFEVLGLGITAADLPLPHRAAGDAEVLGQARLRQPDRGAQGQHGLTKGIVLFPVGGSLHERALSFPCDPQARNHGWKVKGSETAVDGR